MAIGLFFLIHLYRLSAPPNGYHHWRESDTAAVILNYYQEGMNFLEPRVNQRGLTSGITGMELPLLNYTAAVAYQITGPSHAVARLLTVLAACLCLWFFFRLVATLTDDREAAFATWAMAFSPLFFFYSYKIMPDLWMLTLWLASVYLFMRFYGSGRYWYWLASAVCLSLAASIKPLVLSIYLPYLFLIWRRKGRSARDFMAYAAYVVLTLTPVLLWIQYARWLQKTHGLYVFYLGSNLGGFSEYLFNAQFFKKLALQWPSELWVGWVLVPAFFYGLYRAVKAQKSAFYFIWILSIYIVFAITALKSSTHDYYTMIIVPPLAAITGSGLYQLYTSGNWRRILAIILLLMAPVGAFLRIQHRLGPTDDYYAIRAAAEKIIPQHCLVAVQDNTPAIRLYQLNRKGWPLRNGVRFKEVAKLMQDGADFLIVDEPLDTLDSRWWEILETTPLELGSLYGYQAKDMD
jgi:4-amino-4-deoxy-L-arabinose transferase-like glycosyltransferase